MKKSLPSVFLLIGLIFTIANTGLQADELATGLSASGSAQQGEPFNNFEVIPSNCQAGEISDYQLLFQLAVSPTDMPAKGAFLFTFPPGFDLSTVEFDELNEFGDHLELTIEGFMVEDQSVTVQFHSRRKNDLSSDSVALTETDFIDFELTLSKIINPLETNPGSVSGLTLKWMNSIIFGPSLSEPITLCLPKVARIELTPGSAITLNSSERISFSALAYDADDRLLKNVTLAWSLESVSDSIGFMTNSVFTATRVGSGRIKVTADEAAAVSGLITVHHGDLSRIFLDLFPEQLARSPLAQSADAILFDAYDNLVTDYDLQSSPLIIHSSTASLFPDTISDNAFLVGGVVRLLNVPVRHEGATAVSDIFVSSGSISSTPLSVSFSGYDILDLLDAAGETIHQVDAGTTSTAFLKTVNNGTLLPEIDVTVYAVYLSGGGMATTTFAGSANGLVDSVQITLPTPLFLNPTEILRIAVFAEFEINGIKSVVIDAVSYPVTIVSPALLDIVQNSLKPDSIYSGEPFDISFDVATDSLSGPVDSTVLAVTLRSSTGEELIATLFEGLIPGVINESVIEYRNINAILKQIDYPGAGYFPVQLDYRLYSGDLVYVLSDNTPDSIYVLPLVQLSYVSGSLNPTELYADQATSFEFRLDLESGFPIKLYSSGSAFELIGPNYSASSSFKAGQNQLSPGNNQVLVEPIFVPVSQLGNTLYPGAGISYSVFSDAPQFLFETILDSLGLTVIQRPVVQILALNVLAPNRPKVNTLQEFSITGRLINAGEVAISQLELELTSDGSSEFDPVRFFDLPAGDTVDIQFAVIAAAETNSGEIFKLKVNSSEVIQLPPADNTALILIEQPAYLVIGHELVGVENGTVERGQEFGLLVEVVNLGQAATGTGRYRLSYARNDFNFNDTAEGEFAVDEHVNFSFRAPNYDTVINFHYEIIEIPLDSNSQAVAEIIETSFDFSVKVESIEADLLVTPSILGTNLVLPGRVTQLFELELSNLGLSPNAIIVLDQVKILFSDDEGYSVRASDLIVAGNTGFSENGTQVSVTNPGGDEVLFVFNDFVIEPGDDRTLLFEGLFKRTNLSHFRLRLSASDIGVHFETNPENGEKPRVITPGEGDILVNMDLVLKAGSFQESFMIENNPFDPNQGPARMTYELAQSSAVEFRVFSLIGEEVYALDLQPGMPGTLAGENFIEWDGRNSDGRTVLNGVYISTIKIVSSGDMASIKIALVK